MKQQSNLTALKREINKAIEDGNFDRADELSKELCKIQGFKDIPDMPKDFYFQLKRKAGKNKMKVNKKIIKAAIAALVISTSTVTVSAGVYHHILKSKHIDNGIVAYNPEASENIDISQDYKSKFDASKLPDSDKNVVTDIVSNEKTDNDVWLTKTITKETDNQHYASDDGVNWKKEPQYYRYTKYTFNDFEAACDELDMPNIFDCKYTLKENGCYTHNEYKENKKDKKYTPIDDSIGASFSYNKGYFTLSQSRSCDDDNIEENSSEERVFIAITGEKTTNKRDYKSKNNLKFALSDSKTDKKISTSTILSFDNYDILLQFFNLSEKEIHEILDSISI